jgi:hypothetical protein
VLNNPFNYPKSRHKRGTVVPQTKYTKYKRALQIEFERKCVYCRMPDTIKGYDSFGVDHYRPKSLFPQLETVYSNLFYCCNSCNRMKANRWLGEKSIIFVPNPDDNVMVEHLRFKNAYVETVSKAGEYTCELLQLNEHNIVQLRQTLLTSLKALENVLADSVKAETAIKKAFNKGVIDASVRDQDLAVVAQTIAEVQAAIDSIAGRG